MIRLLPLVLAACGARAPDAAVDDTEDTDPTTDTDPNDTEVDTETSDTAPCTTTLGPPAMDPATTCVTSWSCGGSTAATARSTDECEGSWTVFLDDAGRTVSAVHADDTSTCRTEAYHEWNGPPVRDCPSTAPVRSRGCARPQPYETPPVQLGAGPASGETLAAWQTRNEATCHGTMSCPVPEADPLTIAYTYVFCGSGTFVAWNADGAWLGATNVRAWGAVVLPGATEAVRAAVEACLQAPDFTPSPACAVAE